MMESNLFDLNVVVFQDAMYALSVDREVGDACFPLLIYFSGKVQHGNLIRTTAGQIAKAIHLPVATVTESLDTLKRKNMVTWVDDLTLMVSPAYCWVPPWEGYEAALERFNALPRHRLSG